MPNGVEGALNELQDIVIGLNFCAGVILLSDSDILHDVCRPELTKALKRCDRNIAIGLRSQVPGVDKG